VHQKQLKNGFLPAMPHLNTPFLYNEKKIEKSTRNYAIIILSFWLWSLYEKEIE